MRIGLANRNTWSIRRFFLLLHLPLAILNSLAHDCIASGVNLKISNFIPNEATTIVYWIILLGRYWMRDAAATERGRRRDGDSVPSISIIIIYYLLLSCICYHRCGKPSVADKQISDCNKLYRYRHTHSLPIARSAQITHIFGTYALQAYMKKCGGKKQTKARVNMSSIVGPTAACRLPLNDDTIFFFE